MIGIAIALIVALGIGGTAAVADNAKPGDALFGLDQTVENVRMSLTAKEKKDELRIRFAEERVSEIEELSDDSVEEASSTSLEISDTTVTEIEADIFTNETIVKIEHSDNKTVVTLDAKTKEGVIDALAAKYPSLTKAFIEKTISIETEGRSSRAEDKKEKSELSEEDRANLSIGIEAALNLLAGLNATPEDSAKIDAITARLNSYLTDLPSNAEIEVETTIQEPIEEIWEYWNKPEHVTKWCFASDDWHAPRATNDLRIGGKFMTRMESKDGKYGFDMEGTYTDVKEFERIEYVMEDGRYVEIKFKKDDGGCKIIETFDAETENTVELQKSGWQSILDNFKKYVISS